MGTRAKLSVNRLPQHVAERMRTSEEVENFQKVNVFKLTVVLWREDQVLLLQNVVLVHVHHYGLCPPYNELASSKRTGKIQ